VPRLFDSALGEEMQRNGPEAIAATGAVVMIALLLLLPTISSSVPSGNATPKSVPPPPPPPSPIVLVPNGTSFTVSVGGCGPNASYWCGEAVFPFSVNQSVSLVGSWRASTSVWMSVIAQNSTPFCHPVNCGQSNWTFNLTLFPGAFDIVFVPGTGLQLTNSTVTVTRTIEVVFDRVTLVLQASGTAVLGSMKNLNWTVSIPANAKDIEFDSVETITTGYWAGLMDSAQWAVFERNPSSFNWTSLPWFSGASGGVGPGPVITTAFGLTLPLGNYTLVIYNPTPVAGVIDFLTPLYFAYAPSQPK